MTEAEWLACDELRPLTAETSLGPGSPRKLRLVACACCRLAFSRLRMETSRQLTDATELYLADLTSRLAYREVRRAYHQERERRSGSVGRTDETIALLAAGHSLWSSEMSWAAMLTVAEHVLPFRWIAHSGEVLDGHEQAYRRAELLAQADSFRDIFGNPFHPVTFDPAWRTDAVVGLARGAYEDRAFDRLPVLADALEDAGCADAAVLAHCRGPGPHVRGCWVVDLVLGKN